MTRPYFLKQTRNPVPVLTAFGWFPRRRESRASPTPGRPPAARMHTDRGATSGEGGSVPTGEDRESRASGDKQRVALHLCHPPVQANGKKPSSGHTGARHAHVHVSTRTHTHAWVLGSNGHTALRRTAGQGHGRRSGSRSRAGGGLIDGRLPALPLETCVRRPRAGPGTGEAP